MTESKRAYYFVVGTLCFLAYGYVRYASGWLPSAPQKMSIWDRAGKVVEQVVAEVEKEFDIDSSDDASDVPDEDEAYMIAAPPVAALVASVAAKDFTPFYYVISEEWQTRAGTPEFLQTVSFAYLVDAAPKFEGLTGFEISETPEMIDSESLLMIGRAESGTETFSFRLTAIQEEDEWKATGLEIELDP